VTFSFFNTEANFDFVNFFDGADTTADRLNRQSGDLSAALPVYTATAGVAVLQFTSDGSVTRSPGPIEATFACAAPAPAPGPDACVAPITLTDADTGSAQNTAMDYDEGHGNAEDCQWIMTCANADESPIVIFHTFNTETNFDYVNVYDGADTAPRASAASTAPISRVPPP